MLNVLLLDMSLSSYAEINNKKLTFSMSCLLCSSTFGPAAQKAKALVNSSSSESVNYKFQTGEITIITFVKRFLPI